MSCTCVTCGECDGSGRTWLTFSGEYLGNQRCDDLDVLDTCPECGGDGIAEQCEECSLAEYEYEDEL